MKFLKKIFYRCLFSFKFWQEKREKNQNIDNFADLVVLNPIKEDSELEPIPKIIWLYWEGSLPSLVKRCMERIQSMHPDYQVHILGVDNVQTYCSFDLQQMVVQKATPQQRADLIRFNLIYQYGGIWLDASIIVYEKLDWINTLVQQSKTQSFSYFRAKNTTLLEYPVLENWLLASVARNHFYQYWFDGLYTAIEQGPQQYIDEIKKQPNSSDIFQRIGRLEYLVAYVVCQKVMREHPVSMVLINCDKNAFFYQVSHQWMKEKVLIDMAINFAPNEAPKLIKLVGKERKILNKYYEESKYFPNSLLDI